MNGLLSVIFPWPVGPQPLISKFISFTHHSFIQNEKDVGSGSLKTNTHITYVWLEELLLIFTFVRLYNRELQLLTDFVKLGDVFLCFEIFHTTKPLYYLFHDDCIIKASFLLVYPEESTIYTILLVKCTLYYAETIRFVYCNEIIGGVDMRNKDAFIMQS